MTSAPAGVKLAIIACVRTYDELSLCLFLLRVSMNTFGFDLEPKQLRHRTKVLRPYLEHTWEACRVMYVGGQVFRTFHCIYQQIDQSLTE